MLADIQRSIDDFLSTGPWVLWCCDYLKTKGNVCYEFPVPGKLRG